MSFFLNTTVCGFSLYHILAFFLIYSCLGWCVEVVYAAATTGQLVNRGFLNGPVCPISVSYTHLTLPTMSCV